MTAIASCSIQSLLQLLAHCARILEPLVDEESSISSGNDCDQVVAKLDAFFAQSLAAMCGMLW